MQTDLCIFQALWLARARRTTNTCRTSGRARARVRERDVRVATRERIFPRVSRALNVASVQRTMCFGIIEKSFEISQLIKYKVPKKVLPKLRYWLAEISRHIALFAVWQNIAAFQSPGNQETRKNLLERLCIIVFKQSREMF